MSVAKLIIPNTETSLKSDERSDPLDTIIRQAIRNESFLSLNRNGDSPVQWIQLLNVDQQDLPVWPLLTPIKVQMQKCDKCSKEFCSSINYRRHKRVHHRLRKLDKEYTKSRELLAAFWDKITMDEAKEILSFKDLALKEVSGSTIINSLTSLVRKPGLYAFPHDLLRAGSSLLDMIQSKPSVFPLSSHELFSILDDASETTFLRGSAVTLQKYVFDGDAKATGLETKNLVAFVSFLVEEKLVKAWLSDKDAEALKCQKLLMEEEEATQRRQAELAEKKRQKKLRQKEQKAREQKQAEKGEDRHRDVLWDPPSPAHQVSTPTVEVSVLEERFPSQETPASESLQPSAVDAGTSEANTASSAFEDDVPVTVDTIWQQERQENGVDFCRQIPQKLHGDHLSNGFHATRIHKAPDLGVPRRHTPPEEPMLVPLVNGKRKWKPKPERPGSSRPTASEGNKSDCKGHEVLIGSIRVSLDPTATVLHQKRKGEHSSTPTRSGCQTKSPAKDGDDEADVACGVEAAYVEDNQIKIVNSFLDLGERLKRQQLKFSIDAAKAFLERRWKAALAADHTVLKISADVKAGQNLSWN